MLAHSNPHSVTYIVRIVGVYVHSLDTATAEIKWSLCFGGKRGTVQIVSCKAGISRYFTSSLHMSGMKPSWPVHPLTKYRLSLKLNISLQSRLVGMVHKCCKNSNFLVSTCAMAGSQPIMDSAISVRVRTGRFCDVFAASRIIRSTESMSLLFIVCQSSQPYNVTGKQTRDMIDDRVIGLTLPDIFSIARTAKILERPLVHRCFMLSLHFNVLFRSVPTWATTLWQCMRVFPNCIGCLLWRVVFVKCTTLHFSVLYEYLHRTEYL